MDLGKTRPARLSPGWRRVKFGDVARKVNDTVDPVRCGLERYVAGDHMDSDDLHIRRWGTIGDGYLGPAFHMRFRKGNILYGSRRTYLRKVALADFDGICANTTLVIAPKDDAIIPDLLPFVMLTDSFTRHSVEQTRGGVTPYVNWRDLATYEFPLPPISEQRRIAEILWAAEEATEHVSKCVAELEALKRAELTSVFEGSRVPAASFGDVGKWMSGGTPARNCRETWNGTFPWVSPKDMKTPLLADAEEHITEEAARLHSQVAPPGAILLVVRGMILAHTFPVAIAARALAFNQDMKAIVVNERFDRDYVYQWLQHSSRRILNRASESTHGTKRLDTDMLQSLRIPAPPPDSQRALAKVVRQIDLEITAAQAHAASSRRLGRSVLATLMRNGTVPTER